jgi:nitrogen regulatory protein P-II 1
MREVKAIIRRERIHQVIQALHEIAGLPGVTVTEVQTFARIPPEDAQRLETHDLRLCKLEAVVPVALVERVTEAIRASARTGRAGDGMIFVIPVENAIRIRTGARGVEAL